MRKWEFPLFGLNRILHESEYEHADYAAMRMIEAGELSFGTSVGGIARSPAPHWKIKHPSTPLHSHI